MKITVTKVVSELKIKHGWENLDSQHQALIKDTIDVINDKLVRLKNISIKT
jgi:hypothetical protein